MKTASNVRVHSNYRAVKLEPNTFTVTTRQEACQRARHRRHNAQHSPLAPGSRALLAALGCCTAGREMKLTYLRILGNPVSKKETPMDCGEQGVALSDCKLHGWWSHESPMMTSSSSDHHHRGPPSTGTSSFKVSFGSALRRSRRL